MNSSGKSQQINKVPIAFHVRPESASDTDAIDAIVTRDCYHLADLKSRGFAPKIIVDIGAHIGSFAVLAHLHWPNAKIYCLEPDPDTFALLCENAPFAECINQAAGYACGQLHRASTATTGGGFVSASGSSLQVWPPDGEECLTSESGFPGHLSMTTLEELIAEYKMDSIDLLKVDCDSATNLLQNASPWSLSLVKCLMGRYDQALGFSFFSETALQALPHLSFKEGPSNLFFSIEKKSMPLPDFVRKVVADAEPLAQNTSADNLGFGWVYYSLVRNLRPDFVVAIGSARGFGPFCAARALQDNGAGKLIFIDPSYSGDGHPGWGGHGLWSDPAEVVTRIASFGLTGWITHYQMTSEAAFPHVQNLVRDRGVGVVVIDGAHTHEASLQDFELYSSLINGGFAVFHDSTTSDCEVFKTISTLRKRGYSAVTFHREVGLTVVEIPKAASVQQAWDYLCETSNRAELIRPFAEQVIRAGDLVFDAYCGCSPLAALLDKVSIFGFDADPEIIRLLRQRYPEHRWERMDEHSVPFAELPNSIDVLLGLGVTAGYASWDPQSVVNNVRYLLGRYLPRACLFESAAEYHNAEILEDLRTVLVSLGYVCRYERIHTDLRHFAVRKLLMAERI